MSPYKIVIADDHQLFRNLIGRSLQEIPDVTVVGEAGDGEELMNLLKTTSCDLVIVDIGMPKVSGIEATKWIKKFYPHCKVIILTMHNSIDYLKARDESQCRWISSKRRRF